jgi:hypothetical protein
MEPYCLMPGSGRATLINCLIWDCPESLTLTESPYPEDLGSHVTVINCNIEGGQSSAVVSANSTLTWGPGNINADPLFVSSTNRHLQPTSPCIDAGVDPSTVSTHPAAGVTSDLDGTARPLDGNGDATARFDIGAYEFLLPTADSNGDLIPDGWMQAHGLNPVDPGAGAGNPDQDPHTTFEEWVADTDPNDSGSYFRIEDVTLGPPLVIKVFSSAARRYSLVESPDLSTWAPAPGQSNRPGNGGLLELSDPGTAMRKFLRVEVTLP